jgi:3-deoxy-D-manno-octulosonic-acid transferase
VQLFLYNLFLLLYRLAIRVAALFNDKAASWIAGRRDLLQTVKTTLPHNEQRIWIHCASLGEFEQGRPLIEALKVRYPQYKIVLTFFSPSGYELQKGYAHADYVFYLPMDGRKRSARFIRAVNPSLVIFVKYEFWYYYICNLALNHIPVVLVSGAFRREQPFFKWYGGLFRKMLRSFSQFFVQDEQSKELLAGIGISDNVVVAGDTRYDRVHAIAQQAQTFPLIEAWKGTSKLLIAGSTWEQDERLLQSVLPSLPDDWKLIVAPHELNVSHITQIRELFPDSVPYSQLEQGTSYPQRVLVIDNIGMLSSLFRYGEIAFIGGGFNRSGIHNTLEPAVFGLPILFGPVYEKFVEARQLVASGFAFPVADADACGRKLQGLTDNEPLLREKQQALRGFVAANIGATEKIISLLPLGNRPPEET